MTEGASSRDTGGKRQNDGTAPVGGATVSGADGQGLDAGLLSLPGYGVHAQAWKDYGSSTPTSITTPPRTTNSGSMMVAAVVRYNHYRRSLQPSDSYGNTYSSLGPPLSLADWPDSRVALYASSNIAGGVGHTLTISDTETDEVTIFAIELRNVGLVADYRTRIVPESQASKTLTTPDVTVTGPAVIVAVLVVSKAVNSVFYGASNGFTIVEFQDYGENACSGAMAVRAVSSAGTYNTSFSLDHADAGALLIAAFKQ